MRPRSDDPGRLEYDAHSAQTVSSVGSCSIPDSAFSLGVFLVRRERT